MDMCLGAVIRDRRKAMKLTQEDLAEFSGLSVNFISRIERTGDQNISIFEHGYTIFDCCSIR